MNIPEIKSYEEQAVDTVVSVINRAKEKLGVRQTLKQLAISRDFVSRGKISLKSIKPPLAITTENFINNTIENEWKLGKTFMYMVKYLGGSKDEVSQYYYFEALFSQPTASYPIPQAQVSVFFRLEDKQIEPLEERGVPMMYFRIEGQHTDHDVRFVSLTVDSILAIIKMKINFYKKLEAIRLF